MSRGAAFRSALPPSSSLPPFLDIAGHAHSHERPPSVFWTVCDGHSISCASPTKMCISERTAEAEIWEICLLNFGWPLNRVGNSKQHAENSILESIMKRSTDSIRIRSVIYPPGRVWIYGLVEKYWTDNVTENFPLVRRWVKSIKGSCDGFLSSRGNETNWRTSDGKPPDMQYITRVS